MFEYCITFHIKETNLILKNRKKKIEENTRNMFAQTLIYLRFVLLLSSSSLQ